MLALKHPRYSPISVLLDADEYPEYIALLYISSVFVLMSSGRDRRGLLECIHIDGRSVEPFDPCPSAIGHQGCSGLLVLMEPADDDSVSQRGNLRARETAAALVNEAGHRPDTEAVSLCRSGTRRLYGNFGGTHNTDLAAGPSFWPTDHRFEDLCRQ